MNFEIVQDIPDSIYTRIENFAGLTLYHTRPWHLFFRQTFAWRIHALVGYQDGLPGCVLPFVSKRRLGLSPCHIALPLSHQVGFAWDPAHLAGAPEAGQWLRLFPGGVEIHDAIDLPESRQTHTFDTTSLELSGFSNEDEILKSFDYKSIRYPINRALKNNIEVRDAGDEACLRDFCRLMAETRHRQGSPLYPASFFSNMCSLLAPSGAFALYVAYLEGEPVSGALFLRFQDQTVYGYSASVNDILKKRNGANELVMWTAIRDAFRRGSRRMDMGTASLALPGLKAYKEKWGGVSRPLPYSFISYNGTSHAVKRDSTAANLLKAALRKMPMGPFRQFSPWLLKKLV